jgi:hypothetical protein
MPSAMAGDSTGKNTARQIALRAAFLFVRIRFYPVIAGCYLSLPPFRLR